MTANKKTVRPPCTRRLTKEHRDEHGASQLPAFGVLTLGFALACVGMAFPWPEWRQMWLFCAALFFAAKAVVLPDHSVLAFTLFWPGLDAQAFNRGVKAHRRLVLSGMFNFGIGLALIFIAARRVPSSFAGTWVAMIGFVLALHCGVFTLLAAWWRSLGRDVAPLMEAPLLAGSVTEFWGRRWNNAFRDVAHAILFKPVTRRFGAVAGMWAVFIASGVAHELVISVPARAGFGGPTLYFALQAFAMSLERGCPIKSTLFWRLRALAILLAPLPLLFHTPFVMNVCHPFFQAIGALP